jgi:MFS family permease
VSSPFFGPYMFQELHFSYQEYTIGQMSVVATKFLTFPLWGKVVDRQGPRGVYHLAAVMVALVPIPWLWTHGLGWAVVAQVLSGFSWAGHELSYFTLLLRSSWKRTRPITFAAQSICNGSAQIVGGLLGGALMGATARDFHLVFAVSTAARLAVALAIPAWARDRRGGGEPGRRSVLLQVIGFRPGGGLVHRAVEPRRRPPSRRPK